MSVSSLNKKRAEKLHDKGISLYQNGDESGAIAVYQQALAIDAQRATTHYNLGLVYKYQGEWEKSFTHNQIANKLDPDDEAARWNLAIAATALERWDVVRQAWAAQGLKLDGDSGPIDMNFGSTPVRLNPDKAGEVVWATRIDPVRARIENIPFLNSGFRFDDVVLHDGASVGTRMRDGIERPVFNVLELFEQSVFTTHLVVVVGVTEEALEALTAIFKNTQSSYENWTANTQVLCRQCSEGRAHEQHDHALSPTPTASLSEAWRAESRLGVALHPADSLSALLDEWQRQSGAKIVSVD
jgi:tetratricopeptide (TPR) repeat protein